MRSAPSSATSSGLDRPGGAGESTLPDAGAGSRGPSAARALHEPRPDPGAGVIDDHDHQDGDQEHGGRRGVVGHPQVGLQVEPDAARAHEAQHGRGPHVRFEAVEDVKRGRTCWRIPNRRTWSRVAPVARIASTGPGSISSIVSEQSFARDVVVYVTTASMPGKGPSPTAATMSSA